MIYDDLPIEMVMFQGSEGTSKEKNTGPKLEQQEEKKKRELYIWHIQTFRLFKQV